MKLITGLSLTTIVLMLSIAVVKPMIDSSHHQYVSLVEDISAAKPGDVLSTEIRGDTTFVGFAADYPNGRKLILLGN